MSIQAIETRYAGCRFRSRLEARWAVFFDALGVEWEYEPQGYEIAWGGARPRRYLPDFWLPGLGLFAEVKGSDDRADWTLWGMAVDSMAGSGLPDCPRWAYSGFDRLGAALLILGPIPREPGLHPLVFNSKGARCDLVEWTGLTKPRPSKPHAPGDIAVNGRRGRGHDEAGEDSGGVLRTVVDFVGYFDPSWDGWESEWAWEGSRWDAEGKYHNGTPPALVTPFSTRPPEVVVDALARARSARFEFGETS